MIRRPPRSPLLPSTTLFRSLPLAHAQARVHGYSVEPGAKGALTPEVPYVSPDSDPDLLGGFLGICATKQDRKSTRLNSSHANISYAVFCLQKHSESRHYTCS